MRKKKKKRLVVKSTAKDDDYTCFILETHTQFAHYEQYFFLCGVWLLLILFGSILPSSQPIDAQISHSHSTIPFKKKFGPGTKPYSVISNIVSIVVSHFSSLVFSQPPPLSHICVNRKCAPLYCGSTAESSAVQHHTQPKHTICDRNDVCTRTCVFCNQCIYLGKN